MEVPCPECRRPSEASDLGPGYWRCCQCSRSWFLRRCSVCGLVSHVAAAQQWHQMWDCGWCHETNTGFTRTGDPAAATVAELAADVARFGLAIGGQAGPGEPVLAGVSAGPGAGTVTAAPAQPLRPPVTVPAPLPAREPSEPSAAMAPAARPSAWFQRSAPAASPPPSGPPGQAPSFLPPAPAPAPAPSPPRAQPPEPAPPVPPQAAVPPPTGAVPPAAPLPRRPGGARHPGEARAHQHARPEQNGHPPQDAPRHGEAGDHQGARQHAETWHHEDGSPQQAAPYPLIRQPEPLPQRRPAREREPIRQTEPIRIRPPGPPPRTRRVPVAALVALMITIVVAVALVAAGVVPGGLAGLGAAGRPDPPGPKVMSRPVTVAVSRVAAVDFQGVPGQLTIVSSTAGQVTLTGTLHWRGHAPVSEAQLDRTGLLTLSYRCAAASPCGEDYRLAVPGGTAATLSQPSGRVVVTGVTGPLRITAGRADVTATGLRSPVLTAAITSGHLSASFAAPPRQLTIALTAAQATVWLPGHVVYQVARHVSSGYLRVAIPHAGTAARTVSVSIASGELSLLTAPPA